MCESPGSSWTSVFTSALPAGVFTSQRSCESSALASRGESRASLHQYVFNSLLMGRSTKLAWILMNRPREVIACAKARCKQDVQTRGCDCHKRRVFAFARR